jgi:uncharacterized membrane protein
MKAKDFFTQEELDKIVESIEKAELETSGEIRFHLESNCKGDALSRAIQVFKNLKMHKTDLQNGTLIYLATEDKKYAIVGDKGINEKVPDDFWDDVKNTMSEKFKNNEFVSGISEAVLKVGEKLKEYFPHQADDINELSDDVSIGE